MKILTLFEIFRVLIGITIQFISLLIFVNGFKSGFNCNFVILFRLIGIVILLLVVSFLILPFK